MSESWVCDKGASLLVPSGPDNKKHLFVIAVKPALLDGYGGKPMVLAVPVTSKREGIRYDDACEVKAGDHPFIAHDSFIDYRFARVDAARNMEERVKSGIFIAKENCSPDLLARIVRGASLSRRINREFRQILEADAPTNQ